jgi:hypothetical protein
MARVQLADNLSFPPAIVTESVMVLGRKGSGKTNTGRLMFEQMFGLGAQCVALDPVGNWWGLRLSASGKRVGLDIPIFGGSQGSLPLSHRAGKLIAQLIVDRGISCVLDLKKFTRTQFKEFAADFAEELFQLKKDNISPLHLFVEEARLFAPQMLKGKIDLRMLDAFEQIVRLGRNYGLGVSLLDQRPQSVNKEVTSQTEVLIAHQMVENEGRVSIEKWVRSRKTKGADQLEHLDELQLGEAFVWSPGLLRSFSRITVNKKETYDSSATPTLGKKRSVVMRPLSSKDLVKLRDAMADVVAEAEANDPTKLQLAVGSLRRDLAERDRQLAALQNAKTPAPKTVMVDKIVEVQVGDPRLVDKLMALQTKMGKVLSPIGVAVTQAVQLLSQFTTDTEKTLKTKAIVPKPAAAVAPKAVVAKTIPPAKAKAPSPAPATDDDLKVGTAEKKIIRAIAWFESIGITQPAGNAVAFLSGYSPKGGYYNNTRGAMRTAGLLEYGPNGTIMLTDLGRGYAPPFESRLTNEDIQKAALDELSGAEKTITQAAIDAYPSELTSAELAAAAGLDPTGGYYNNTRGRLHTIGLLDYPRKGYVKANALLFAAGE